MVDEEATTPESNASIDQLQPDFSPDYPDWSNEEEMAANLLINDMIEYYPDYSLPQGMEVTENSDGAHYYDRNNDQTPPGQPLIEVKPSRKITSMAHELGHDVLLQSMPDIGGSRIVYSTFKEMFADLNTLHFTDVEPEDRALDRDPDKDLSVYDGVGDLLEPRHWEKGVMRIDKIMEGLENGSWESIQSNAKVLAGSPPQAGPVLDVRDFPYERAGDQNYLNKLVENPEVSHMFYNNFFGARDYSPVTEVAETTHDIWSMAQVLGNSDIMHPEYPVGEAEENHSRIWGKMAHAATELDDFSLDDIRDKPVPVLSQALETDLWDARENMTEIRDNLETVGEPQYFVMNSISGLKYGKPYDTSIDYPHNLGGQLAEQLYRAGAEPMDIVDEPADYLQLSAEAINQHIRNNI